MAAQTGPDEQRGGSLLGGVDSQSMRTKVALGLTLACLTGFVVLTIMVWTGNTHQVDVLARERFRPDDVWGAAQLRADWVVEGLKPRNTYLLLGLAAGAASAVRGSLRPLLFVAAVALTSALTTLAIKVLVERPDPHGHISTIGGSYPSGHMMGVWVCVGGIFWAWRARSRWWHLLPTTVVASAMAWCLLLQAAHWLTDVVGGSLLACSILAWAGTFTLERPTPSAARRGTAGRARPCSGAAAPAPAPRSRGA